MAQKTHRARIRTRKSQRAAFILAAVVILGAAVLLALTALEDTVVYFYSPTDVAQAAVPPGQPARVGGLVTEGSVRKAERATVFDVSDLNNSITISYGGILPDLFREGQGIVAEGSFGEDGTFQATRVLAKHDENYMPPEVADALKESGRWKHAEDGGGDAAPEGYVAP